jgi:hypothetical protein
VGFFILMPLHASRAHFIEIAFPLDLPSQAADSGLPFHLNQQPQPLFDYGALGRQTGHPYGFPNQLVINRYSRARRGLQRVLCIA